VLILLGAERVIGIDRFPERLQLAKDFAKAEVINYEEVDAGEALKEMTGGRGPDACIDAVGIGSTRHRSRRSIRPSQAGRYAWKPIAPKCCDK
jgi:threonine dehydrogenase-like Zn-dependent dehydrogenase